MKLSPKECLDKFVYYIVTTKRGKRRTHYLLKGVQFEKGYLHKFVDLCEFEDKKTKIPKSAVKKQVDRKRIKLFFCHEPIPFPSLNGLEQEEWIKEAEKKSITKATIDKMKPKEKLEVLFLDWDLYDATMSVNKPNRLYKPTYFFRKNKGVFKKEEGGKGMIKYPWSNKFEPFELHVEWKKFHWYPLTNGILPARDRRDQKLLGKKMSWDQLSSKTRVGWNGPMVKWSDIKKMSSLFWYEK